MKYMLLIYDDGTKSEALRQQCYADSAKFAQRLAEKGQFLGANPLQPVSTATSVQIRGAKRIVTDGPFAETREQLGGYFLIDVPDLDEALRVAAEIPGAQFGTVEIRPILEISGIPGQPA